MKLVFGILLGLVLMMGCSNTTVTPLPPAIIPTAATERAAPLTPSPAVTLPRRTATLVVVTPTPTIFPTPYAGTLTLTRRDSTPGDCAGDFSKLASQGLELFAFVPLAKCEDGGMAAFQNGEIGMFQIGAQTYIAQSGLFNAAFSITEVTNPLAPQLIGVWDLPPESHTYDLKPFRQGDKHYLALGLDRNRKQPELPCGIVIVDVTNVRQPKIVTRLDGRNVGAPEPWCKVHTLEIDTDPQGNATYLIVSDVDTYSARAVDIRDLQNAREVNFYHLHAHPHTAPEQPVLNYVHDSYIAKDKIYLANWLAGVVILDKQKFLAGEQQEPIIIKPTENVAPGGFHVHYVAPIANGDFIFIEDELNADNGIRLLDIRDPKNPKTVWVETNPGGVNAPHNFVIRDDLLFVGWYNDGVKIFRFDMRDPNKPSLKQIAFQEVRADKNISRERYFDGVWGVRVNDCVVKNVKRICVYASDIAAGLIVVALN